MNRLQPPPIPGVCFYCNGASPDTWNDQGKACHDRCHRLGRKGRRAIQTGRMGRKLKPRAGS